MSGAVQYTATLDQQTGTRTDTSGPVDNKAKSNVDFSKVTGFFSNMSREQKQALGLALATHGVIGATVATAIGASTVGGLIFGLIQFMAGEGINSTVDTSFAPKFSLTSGDTTTARVLKFAAKFLIGIVAATLVAGIFTHIGAGTWLTLSASMLATTLGIAAFAQRHDQVSRMIGTPVAQTALAKLA